MERLTRARQPAQMFALLMGVAYLLIGIFGFTVTGFDDIAANTDEQLLIFDLNPLHNIVHIALGVVWLIGGRTAGLAKTVNLILGIALLAVFVLGLFGRLTWLSIDGAAAPDNYLHLLTGLLSTYFGSAGVTRARGSVELS